MERELIGNYAIEPYGDKVKIIYPDGTVRIVYDEIVARQEIAELLKEDNN